MKNGADISYKANISFVFKNDLQRKQNGTHHGRETENGLRMAIAYIDSIEAETLTENELKHAIRLSTFRGTETDYRAIK